MIALSERDRAELARCIEVGAQACQHGVGHGANLHSVPRLAKHSAAEPAVPTRSLVEQLGTTGWTPVLACCRSYRRRDRDRVQSLERSLDRRRAASSFNYVGDITRLCALGPMPRVCNT